ncbi:MAG: hypothetical protein K6B44_11010 [Lachnospiraceae bacterium]|nr:hypothetical protein [Lachnospiraceae bacterium]
MDIANTKAMTEYASSLAQAQNAGKLGSNAKAAKTDEEMMEACKEFETYLWEQVVKSMKDSTKVFSGEDDSSSQQVDYFMDTAITDMAGKLTDQNLGPNSLAMQMFEQMKRNQGISSEELMEKLLSESQEDDL